MNHEKVLLTSPALKAEILKTPAKMDFYSLIKKGIPEEELLRMLLDHVESIKRPKTMRILRTEFSAMQRFARRLRKDADRIDEYRRKGDTRFDSHVANCAFILDREYEKKIKALVRLPSVMRAYAIYLDGVSGAAKYLADLKNIDEAFGESLLVHSVKDLTGKPNHGAVAALLNVAYTLYDVARAVDTETVRVNYNRHVPRRPMAFAFPEPIVRSGVMLFADFPAAILPKT